MRGIYIMCDEEDLSITEQQAMDLNSLDSDTRYEAVETGNLTPEQHQVALNDENYLVRIAAIMLGGLSPEQIENALNDEMFEVREAVEIILSNNNEAF